MIQAVGILGHGIAATIANNSLADLNPVLISGNSEPVGNLLESHNAIFRFRLPELGYVLGCELKKVSVWKQIFYSGELRDKPNISANNLYSIKVSGAIASKSIIETGFFDRYVIPRGTVLGQPPTMQAGGWKEILQRQITGERPFSFLISTIPLDVTAKFLEETAAIKSGLSFESKSIEVAKVELPFNSGVYQTIYFPEEKFATYRASLEENILTLEGVSNIRAGEGAVILNCFGISSQDLAFPVEKAIQSRGKMVPVNDDLRRRFIHFLTEKFRIISFGRFAIWKPIRTDDLLRDIRVVRRIITSAPEAVDYAIRREHAQ